MEVEPQHRFLQTLSNQTKLQVTDDPPVPRNSAQRLSIAASVWSSAQITPIVRRYVGRAKCLTRDGILGCYERM